MNDTGLIIKWLHARLPGDVWPGSVLTSPHLPLWTRFGALFLSNGLFPRDYPANPVLENYARRRRRFDVRTAPLIGLLAFPFWFPACLWIRDPGMAIGVMILVLAVHLVALPLLSGAHVHAFVSRRLDHIPFQQLVLTRLTPTEIIMGITLPAFADAHASIKAGLTSFVVCVMLVVVVSGHPAGAAMVFIVSLFVMLLINIILTAMCDHAGIVVTRLCLTERRWQRRISGNLLMLVPVSLLVALTSLICLPLGLVIGLILCRNLRSRTEQIAYRLRTYPEDWWVYGGE